MLLPSSNPICVFIPRHFVCTLHFRQLAIKWVYSDMYPIKQAPKRHHHPALGVAAEADVPKSLGAGSRATEAQPLNPESADNRMGNLN